MQDKKEIKRLLGFAKKILPKQTYKKLRKLGKETGEEKQETIKYSIKARLERLLDYFENKIKDLKKQGKDVFFIETKLHSLKGKVRLFTATYCKKDFKGIKKTAEKIQEEIENV